MRYMSPGSQLKSVMLIARRRVTKVYIFIFLAVVAFYAVLKFSRSYGTKKPHGPIAISTVTYYDEPKYYQWNHSAVVMFRSYHDIDQTQKWLCISKNSTDHTLTSPTSPKIAFQWLSFANCKLYPFLAACETVANPTSIQLTTSSSSLDPIELPFKPAIKEKLPVVSCVGSIALMERWQMLVLSIETYAYFGVDRQAYYFLSGIPAIESLLKAYEKEGLIDLHYIAFPEMDEIDSKLELDMRDIAGTLNDCFMTYRQAADFIIVNDVDDILMLRNGRQYHSEFAFFTHMQPETDYFHYESYVANIRAPKKLADFDIVDTLNTSLMIPPKTGHWGLGKSVYNTSCVETVHFHEPLTYEIGNLNRFNIPAEYGVIFHARNWFLGDSPDELVDIDQETKELNELYPNVSSIISNRHIAKMGTAFKQRMKSFMTNRKIASLESSELYYKLMDDCLFNLFYSKVEGGSVCRTFYSCNTPPFTDVKCVLTKQSYDKVLVDKNLAVYVPQGDVTTFVNDNGCHNY